MDEKPTPDYDFAPSCNERSARERVHGYTWVLHARAKSRTAGDKTVLHEVEVEERRAQVRRQQLARMYLVVSSSFVFVCNMHIRVHVGARGAARREPS